MDSHAPSPLPREARPYQGLPAGLVTRFVAALIDAVVVALALAVGYAGLAGFVFLVDPRSFTFPAPRVVMSLTVALAVLILYLTVAWWFGGRTYGDLVMGLRVVSRAGGPVHLVIALLRAVACVLFPLGLLWVAFSRDLRSVQDVVLRTSVVYDWQHRGVDGEGHGSANSPR